MITCLECGTKVKRITPTHLRGSKCSGLVKTVAEYQKKYPGAPILMEGLNKKTAITLENLIRKYGEIDGKGRWEAYCKRQSETNTFEYKKKKYGWTKNQFDEYNKSRAITLENLTKKYGEERGTEAFEEYCWRQKYTNTLPYFIEREGSYEAGLECWKKVNDLKGKTYDPKYLSTKYGITEEEALEMISNRGTDQFYSVLEKQFVGEFQERVGEVPYSCLNRQFSIYSRELSKIFFVDVCCTERNKIVEFHGDYWHANPSMYNGDVIIKGGASARDIWKRDELKAQAIRDRGFKLYVVWESEYRKDPDDILTKLEEWWNEDQTS